MRCSFILIHDAPASSLRYTPPSSASISAQRRPGFARDTVMPLFPQSPPGRPLLRVSSAHVSPPSVLFHMPLAVPPLHSFHGRR